MSFKEKEKKNESFEPDLNQRPMDVRLYSNQLQSTALPTELSKATRNKMKSRPLEEIF